MSHRITIARPLVNLKAFRRHRNPPPLALERKDVTQADMDQDIDADISLLDDYQQRLVKLATSRSSEFSLSLFSFSTTLFLVVCVAKRLKITYFSVQKFRYPSLIVATTCSSIGFSLLLFPFLTFAALFIICTVIKYGKLLPVASQHVLRATNAKLSSLEALLTNRAKALRISFEQNTGRIIGKLEQQQQHQQHDNSTLLPKMNLLPELMDPPTIREIDPELGQITPSKSSPGKRRPSPQVLRENNLPSEKDIRSQKLSVLRELRPDHELELNCDRLRTSVIPQFDAEGWLLVTNPEFNVRISEELKGTGGADADLSNERWAELDQMYQQALMDP